MNLICRSDKKKCLVINLDEVGSIAEQKNKDNSKQPQKKHNKKQFFKNNFWLLGIIFIWLLWCPLKWKMGMFCKILEVSEERSIWIARQQIKIYEETGYLRLKRFSIWTTSLWITQRIMLR